MEVVKWILVGVSIPVIGWLLARTRRNAGMLNERIDEYHREQEELEKRGGGKRGPVNPYEQMSELFGPNVEKEKENDKDE
jgi:hypothetical protein